MDRNILLKQTVSHAMEWGIMLAPLAVYLLVLGLWVNRQRRPVAVRGTRSMAGLLAGLSGLLLLGPPSWIAYLFRRPDSPVWYWLAYAGYVVLVLIFARLLIRRESGVLVLYNLDAETFADTFQPVLDEVNLPYSATPGRVAFAGTSQVLDIEPVHMLNNITLTWQLADDPVRSLIEPKLVRALESVESGYNPAVGILTLAGAILSLFIVFASVLYLIYFFGWLVG